MISLRKKAVSKMGYRALYREWRPKDFSHVVGQKAIIETLRNQVMNKRIAHAYLFCGSRGTGKTSTAKILAKAINCLNPKDGDPCGECENCRRLELEESLDVVEIDAASNNGVDEIRVLRDTVKYPPQYGKYKVYIIDEVHMLSPAAFNALLKTLEEPPAHIVFILATTEPQKLPETILSRCQRFDFGRLSLSELAGRLKEAADGCGASVSNGALMLIARTAEGGMRDALSILDMCLGYREQVDEELVRSILGSSDSSFLFDFCESFADGDPGKVFRMIDEIMREGKDPAVFSRDVCRHIRALLIAKTGTEELIKVMDITKEEADDYIRQGEKFTVTRLLKILDLFMSLETEMRYAATPRLALENAGVKCCLRLDETNNQALHDRITELEQKIAKLERNIAEGNIREASHEKNKQDMTNKDAEGAERKKHPDEKGEQKEPAPRTGANPPQSGTAVWNEMMGRFKKTEPMIWSFLLQGNLVSSSHNVFIWQTSKPGNQKLYVDPLNQQEKKKKICDCLSELTGSTCDFRAIGREQALPTEDTGEEAYLKKLYETFGTEPVDVIDVLPGQ